MDFKTLLMNRRSIRDLQDREVPLSVVQEILQDTCLAPIILGYPTAVPPASERHMPDIVRVI